MNAKEIFSNWIVKNLLWAIVIFIALVVTFSIFLKVVTQHNKTITVPDFTNMTVSEARSLAERSDVRIDVIDSVVVKRMVHGAIYKQDPEAGSMVKKGRRVVVVINSVTPKKVMMPNVVNCSMRQAKAELLSRGLLLGRLIYVNDIATNNVLRQLKNGKDIRPGALTDSESLIDLVVGLNSSECITTVPKVTGLKGASATDVIHDYSLNVGRRVYDNSVRNYADSLSAVVYRQDPANIGSTTYMGSDITLYLTTSEEKVPCQ